MTNGVLRVAQGQFILGTAILLGIGRWLAAGHWSVTATAALIAQPAARWNRPTRCSSARSLPKPGQHCPPVARQFQRVVGRRPPHGVRSGCASRLWSDSWKRAGDGHIPLSRRRPHRRGSSNSRERPNQAMELSGFEPLTKRRVSARDRHVPRRARARCVSRRRACGTSFGGGSRRS